MIGIASEGHLLAVSTYTIADTMNRAGMLIMFSVLMLSCNKLKPAGFWSDYHEQLLEENQSDLGPWGGFVAMHWRARGNLTFSIKNIADFAEQNGWARVDTISITGETVRTWMDFSKPVFPFAYTDFSDQRNLCFVFPRWIDSDAVIYRFRTGWIAVQPGNARQTDINGYIVISADKRQFSVYNLWGE